MCLFTYYFYKLKKTCAEYLCLKHRVASNTWQYCMEVPNDTDITALRFILSINCKTWTTTNETNVWILTVPKSDQVPILIQQELINHKTNQNKHLHNSV